MTSASGPSDARAYDFGPFRVDPAARMLLRDGVPVPLLPKSFDALLVLVRNNGRLLDKAFLLAEIWPDAHVEENNLARAISDIRKALGEGPKDQVYVVTVARRGYRFAPPVELVEPGSAPGVIDGAPATSLPAPVAVVEAPVSPVSPGSLSPDRRLSWRVVGGLATVGLLAAAGLAWMGGRSSPAAPLTERDGLVLADFTNQTGEPVFDDVLREALAVQLERSPFLKVMGETQLRQNLRLMGRAPTERVTDAVARDVCTREGQKAMIGGSIVRLGAAYTLLVQATACESGETLAREQADAADKGHVLSAIAVAATALRTRLGESLASIEALDRHPITQVTTPSLEAFQAFARGTDQFRQGQWLNAVPFFQRAVELDPAFAMAWHQLGTAYGNAGERALAAEYAGKAFALRNRVSERERQAITVTYHMRVSGDMAAAGDAVQLFVQTFPRATIPRSWRGEYYMLQGAFEKAAQDYEELVRLDPRSRIGYMNLMWVRSTLGELDTARAVAARATTAGLDMPEFHHLLLDMALMQGADAEAQREIAWFAGREDEHLGVTSQAVDAIARGRLRTAARLLARAATLAEQRNLHGLAARLRVASTADVYGPCQDDLSGTLLPCADLDAETRQAEARLAERPADTLLAAVHLPTRRAARALGRDQAAEAVAVLQSATPFERRYPEVAYLRGQAFLKMGKNTEAEAEFRKIVDHRGAAWGSRYPLAMLGLARAAARNGQAAAARTAYDSLLTLWKDADPDLPLLVAARAEHAALPPQ